MAALLAATPVLAIALTAGVAQASFPGANGKIAFERTTDTGRDLFAIDPDGSDEVNLTHNGANNRELAWSPDGSHAAFFSDGNGLDDYYDIHVARADGKGLPVRVSTTGNARSPAWSPNGRLIAFVDDYLYTVHPDGTGLRVLVGTGWAGYPAWSPDGSKISFAFYDGFAAPDIYVANADGSDMRKVTEDGDHTNGWSTWSPDGTRLTFGAGRADCVPFTCQRIYVVDADGTDRRRLTDADGSWPRWSPDGSEIGFQAFRGGVQQIYTINPDGTRETRITNSATSNYGPEWSPDSAKLLFSRSSTTPPGVDVYIINRDGTGERYVTEGSSQQWQPIPLRLDPKRLCKRERRELGNKRFRKRYGPARSSAAALRNCIARRS